MAESRRARNEQGYLVIVSHPTSGALRGWEGPFPHIAHVLRAEVYSHLAYCYNDVQEAIVTYL